MALGGGTFTAQNKILPGTYINFVSVAKASTMLSERGIVAMPFELDWGKDGEVFKVTADDFSRHAREIFGYDYDAPEILPVREVFKGGARLLYAYKLNAAQKAANAFATAACGGLRGNDIKIVIAASADNEAKFDVTTLLGNTKIETQTVTQASDLVDNAFVRWKKDAALEATAGTPLTGGENGEVSGDSYQAFLDAMESYSFHALGCPSAENTIRKLFVAYTKRMRDEVGAKFQTIGYRMTGSNYEGIISIRNACMGADLPEYGLVYWTAGAEAACKVNATVGNKVYDGEYSVDAEYTQQTLEDGILAGDFLFHKVDGEVRVLEDINTFTGFTNNKSSDFALNQVVRVLDQIANDTATLFNRNYLDKVQNNASGRVALWNDLVTYHAQLQTLGAIENFESKNITVTQGEGKRSVVVQESVTPVAAMEQLYMSVVVE